jgi:hypothetical protein
MNWTLLRAHGGRRSKDFRVWYQQTNKQIKTVIEIFPLLIDSTRPWNDTKKFRVWGPFFTRKGPQVNFLKIGTHQTNHSKYKYEIKCISHKVAIGICNGIYDLKKVWNILTFNAIWRAQRQRDLTCWKRNVWSLLLPPLTRQDDVSKKN